MSSDPSSSTAVGIVTAADDQYLYVWSKAVDPGATELRFNKCQPFSHADIKVGTWVHFDRSGETGPDGVQTGSLDPADWVELIAPIVRMNLPGGCVWRASCVVTFCPPDYAAYVQAKASYSGLLGLAYSDHFGHIALLDGKLRYEVGKVYQARVRRIVRAQDDVARAVGTLFCISVGSMFDVVRELRDEDVCNELLDQTPWPREGSVQKPETSNSTDVKFDAFFGQALSIGVNNNGDFKDLQVVTDSKLPWPREDSAQKRETSDGTEVKFDTFFGPYVSSDDHTAQRPREDPVEKPSTSRDSEVARRTCPEQTLSSGVNNNGDFNGSKVVTDPKLDATPSADHFYEGIVYDLRQLYVLAYVRQFRLNVVALYASVKNDVRPAVGALLKFRLREAEGFIFHLGIPYQAIAVEEIGAATNGQLLEVLQIVEKKRKSNAHPRPSASSSWDSVQGSRATSDDEQQDANPELMYEGVVYDVEPSCVDIYVSSIRKTAVALTNDAFQPPVGTLLKFRLKRSLRYFGSRLVDSPEEIGVVDNDRLLDVMKAVYQQQEMPGAQELAPNYQPYEPPSQSHWERHDHLLTAVDNEQKLEAPKPTFAAPENWNFTPTDEKATDLLGVAVDVGRSGTTFYTSLGTVKIPVEAQLGVWVRMDVTLTEGGFVQRDDDVLRIEQLLPPPMDTRVIRGKRVMLAAEVEKHPDGVGNQFLGAVLDRLSLLPRDSPYGLFVAELEFVEGCFEVVRYHKPSSLGVPVTVPLEESAYPLPEDHRGLAVQAGILEYAELLQLQHDM